jgi:hypothetical protein
MSLTCEAALATLNVASLGSFGEAVFAAVAASLGWHVEWVHRGRVDFVVDGLAVDVKTSVRRARRAAENRAASPTVDGIKVQFARVEFDDAGAHVTLEGHATTVMDWPALERVWQTWVARRGEPGALLTRTAARGQQMAAVKAAVRQFFASRGMEARVIARACAGDWGGESPHNLVPTQTKLNRLTIYLEFEAGNPSEDGVRRVYAFRDQDAKTLPHLEKTRLHIEKVDLARMPATFVFADLEDLRTHYDRLLGG